MTISRKAALVSSSLITCLLSGDSDDIAIVHLLWEILPTIDSMWDLKKNSISCTPESDDVAEAEQYDGDDIQPFRTLSYSR
jgi:hypothetical protein